MYQAVIRESHILQPIFRQLNAAYLNVIELIIESHHLHKVSQSIFDQ